MKNINCYLSVENKGEIDVNAFKLLGATSKIGQNKIGYFGTGLKYAIAVFLRNKMEFKIFSGLKEIRVDTVRRKFRGQDFDVIRINGEPTSLTTSMGRDWEEWFAVREVYCNALDEEKCRLTVEEEMNLEAGKTKFYIKYDSSIKDIFNNWNNYFSEKREDVLLQKHSDKILAGGERLIIYRKGINVYDEERKCLFNYDMDQVDINESRTLKYDWMFRNDLVRWLAKNANREVIEKLFKDFPNTYEATLDWETMFFSKTWLEVLDGRNIILRNTAGAYQEYIGDDAVILPDSLAFALEKCFEDKVKIIGFSSKYGHKKILEPTETQAQVLGECRSFLEQAGINIPYEIQICEFTAQSILGEGKEGVIFLSPKLFDEGKKEIVATIIEEYAHLDSGEGDKTRGFQNYLIKKFVGSLEEKTKIYL